MDIGVQKVVMLKGEAGNSIASITITGETTTTVIYTVTLTDGSTTQLEVEKGVGIETIEKTSTSGLVDTYTITLSNGNTSTFTVTNGQSFTVPQNAVVYYTGDEIPEGYEDTQAPPSGSGAEINDNVPTLSTTFSGVKIDTLVGRILTGTLTAGQTTLVLSDNSIDSDTIIANIYVDTFGANPESITVATGSITLTFTAMVSDLSVKVRII